MSLHQIELLGGPRDGMRIQLPDTYDEIRVPAPGLHPALGLELRYLGVYRPLTEQDRTLGRWTWRSFT